MIDVKKELVWHYYDIINYLDGYTSMRVDMTGEASNWILIGVCCVVSMICFIILHKRKAWWVILRNPAPKRYRFERIAMLILGTSIGVLFRITGGIAALQFEMCHAAKR